MNNSPTEDVSQTLASHIANLTYDDLPGHVISATKLAILDTIAATIAGSNQPGILETLSTLIQWGGVQESSLAIWGQKLPAHEAVIANVAMAHALEIDDSHYPAIVHPTAPTLWAALATAEAKGGVSGKDLLLAVVAGVDLMVRMGLAAPRTLYLGYHTAMFSGFGAAAAAGKLRNLDSQTLQSAFGITFSQASATVQAATDGALVKRLQPAFNAADGMRAVSFAERGITGIRNAFEGPYGLYRLFNHSICDRGPLLDRLGTKFYGDELTIKRYPTSRCAHGPIEATLALIHAHDIKPGDVESVVVEVSEGCLNICGAPYEPTGAGSQTLAQFNIPFTVAAAVLWRDVFVAEVQAEAIIDPAVLDIAKRISVVANPTLSGGVAFVPVTVRIMLRDGTKLEHTVTSLKGSPETPMSWDEIVEERFLRSVRFSARPFSEAQIELLQETVKALEDLTDSARLVEILNGAKATPLALKPITRPKTFETQTAPSSGDSDAIVALAAHVERIGFDDIPSKAIDATKKLILDLISTTIAGSGAPGTAATIDLLKATGGRPQSRIAIYGGALPAHHAVTANIMMCHALELDDLYDPSVVHSSAPAFWSAMAAAESLGGASGRDLLTAMIVASDIMCRLGAAAPRTFSLGHHNALLAGFAAVAAAGYLRKTSANILHNAFGIAFSQAAASVQALPDGSLIKRLQPALNAADGLRSLDFAQNGVTGVINVLEGKFGFCQLFGHAPCDRELLLQDLGSSFLGAESSIKRFPSSRCTHAPIEATLAILKSRKIPIDQIISIKCMVSQVCADVAGQPFSPTDGSPQVKAQFSIPYTIAATLVNGDFFIPQVTGDICNPRVMDLAQRVEVSFLEEVGDRMTFMPIELAIKMKSGETIFHRLEALKGTPQNPMNWEEIIDERLTRCLAYSVRKLSEADISRLIELVQNLEHVPDARAILDILT